MMKNARMPVHELNPYLTCVLCGGYLIDATTIIECLHSFCRTCIVHYLHTSNYCPVCECLVHKKHPHQNLRSDKTLQDVVYKLVPGLFMEEMRRRRQYYNVQTDDLQSKSGRIIFSPDEKISLCVRLCTRKMCSSNKEDNEFQDKRYLLCPAQMSVLHLKKFLRLKYSLSDRLEVVMFHLDEVLKDEYSLMDVSYITGWRREKAMVLNYAFYKNPNKKFKTNVYSGAVSPSNDDSGIEDENSNQDGGNNPDQNHVTSRSSPAASKETDNQQNQTDESNKPSDPHPAEIPEQVLETADADDANSDALNDASQPDANQDVGEKEGTASDELDDDGGGIQDEGDRTLNNDDDKISEKEECGENEEMKESCSADDEDQCKKGEGSMEASESMETNMSSQETLDVHENDNQSPERKEDSNEHAVCIGDSNNDTADERRSVSPKICKASDNCSNNIENGNVQSPKSNGAITFEDEEGALQIVIDDSKSEKSSDDSGVQLSENSSSKESDSLCSTETRSPTVTIKIPNPEIFSRKSPIPFQNGVRNHHSKSPKTSTPLNPLHSPSRKYPRFSESLSFNDSGYSPYRSFHDPIPRATSCPQTDFDADEIWTDGVMDLSKPKAKHAELSQFQEAKTSSETEADDSEEVEKYTYVADDLEEGDGNMVVDSGYANENKTPERYSLISPDQNEVTSTRVDHVPYHAPMVFDRTPQVYAPKFTSGSNFVWKIDKSSTDVSKKSSSGKHHKRRRSSDGSKHKVALSKAHSKCTDVCNGHSVVNHSHISTTKNKHCEKLILNQPRCEKLVISQSRCEKAPNNKPRCEKLVVKLSKERNSEHYTATMS